MITFELAKELKDAGFGFSQAWCLDMEHCEHPTCVFPTLSELIEACGDDFSILQLADMRRNSKNRWYASSTGQPKGYGKTSEEAVARLWLALNKS